MKLSIIIVSWNVRDDLNQCLLSLQSNPLPQAFEIIVVDNNSSDGTVELVKNTFPDVRLIENRENRGFAGANNQGLDIANGEYVFLLNPDTIVHSGSLTTLVGFLDKNADVGACGGRLLNQDGSIQASVRRFPTFRAFLYRNTICRTLCLFRGSYGRWKMKDFKYDKQIEVDQLMGAAMMIRKSIIDEIGGMDETFFMYLEEVDLCLRIKQAGWKVVFLPEADITHLGGQSSKQAPSKRIMLFKSMFAYFRKHRGRGITFVFSIIFKIGLILRSIVHLCTEVPIFVAAMILKNPDKKQKAANNISLDAKLLTKYIWKVITI